MKVKKLDEVKKTPAALDLLRNKNRFLISTNLGLKKLKSKISEGNMMTEASDSY